MNKPTEALTADVAVVGGGNAALAAALAAAEGGARVTLLEAAPEEERGGNSTYTAGAMRVVFDGADALRALMPDLSEPRAGGDRLRRLHRGGLLRRHGAASPSTAPSRTWSSSS